MVTVVTGAVVARDNTGGPWLLGMVTTDVGAKNNITKLLIFQIIDC